jgi:DNA-binding NtrC family response regulator
MKRTLLIAEGDAELCDIYRSFLSECGYLVETASDGLDCLTKLRQVSPAVLVQDREIRSGGADGVLAWLREERYPSKVAVVLTATGRASPETSEEIRSPVVRFLTKPFALTVLLQSVRAAVAEKRPEEPLISWNRGAAYSEFFLG